MDRAALLAQVGQHLIEYRIGRGLDGPAAAAAAGIDDTLLAAAENGEQTLTSDQLERLGAVYEINPAAFFGGRTTPIQNYAGG